MMTRAALHSIATVIALYASFRIISAADMWLRMTIFAFAWAACGLAYLGMLYFRQFVLDVVDERVRRALRHERTVDEMRRYERRLRFVMRWRKESVDTYATGRDRADDVS